MMALGLGELARVVGGQVVDGDPGVEVTGPAFLDSRAVEPGGLFVAFEGERVDGHEYAAAAVAAGAAAVLGSRPTGAPTVVVGDVRTGLQRLARRQLRMRRRHELEEHREDFQVTAITGSQGKTSAKDMLARVLAAHGPTVATAGSFNNELGLPLTVLRLTAETRHLVLEMGARGIGHLAELCEIAPPDIALVLNVGKAHLGEFGSQENIARAKGEIVEALREAGGGAVLNADDPLVLAMSGRTLATTTTFGTAEDADVRLSGIELDDLGRPSFDLTWQGRTEHVELRLLGAHQAMNAAAVAAAAVVADVPFAGVCETLRSLETLSRWRMEVRERPDGLVVVNDAYNANPDSMRSALETLARMGGRAGRRTVAVLGAMRELGETSEEEHRVLGELAHRLDIDQVVVVGDAAAAYDALLAARGDDGTTRHVGTLDEAWSWVRENVRGPDVVLVKASRSERFERLADLLMDTREETRG